MQSGMARTGQGCADVADSYPCIVCGESGTALCGSLRCAGAYCREHLEELVRQDERGERTCSICALRLDRSGVQGRHTVEDDLDH